MAWEHKEGQGSVKENDKGDNPRRPDWKGDGMWGGVVYDIAIWRGSTKDGVRKYDFKIAPKVADHQQERVPSAPPMRRDMDDEIPF
jgi:hypothetical protein